MREEKAMNDPETMDQFVERMRIFMRNRDAFPLDELMKYAGQWIAWSPDTDQPQV